MALTDTFYSRYRGERLVWRIDGFPPECATVLRQATHVLFKDLSPLLTKAETFWTTVHDELGREMAAFVLAEGQSHEERCGRFLGEPFDLWRDDHRDPDYFFKTRVSLIEIALRHFEARAARLKSANEATGGILSWMSGGNASGPEATAFELAVRDAVEEVNARFRQAQIPLTYHDGHIQLVDDEVTAAVVEKPFWDLVRDPKWENVRIDMKEGLDRRDTSGRDAAFYALKALESVIKVISKEKGFTTGREKGAANFVDNLVSKANGRFIDPWEAEQLKALFKHLRNPHSHGPGSDRQPNLTAHQQTWVIESVMVWAKSLIRRT
jgi:hypothetical protein